jgi:hypothetical protein
MKQTYCKRNYSCFEKGCIGKVLWLRCFKKKETFGKTKRMKKEA